MDPLSALSAAGTIIQFVDFGRKLLSDSRQLYVSANGILDSHEQLGRVTSDLQSVIVKLKGTWSVTSGETTGPFTECDENQESSFQRICDDAIMIAEELLNRLGALKVNEGGKKRWESLKVAVKSAWSKDEIAALMQRLSIFRESLNSRILFSIRKIVENHDALSSARFDSLEAQTQRILGAVIDNRDALSRELLVSITNILCHDRGLNQDEHHKTRQMISQSSRAIGSESCIEQSTFTLVDENTTEEIEPLDVTEARERNESVQGRLLSELSYATISSRYEDVIEAHPSTFNWVFCDTTVEQLPWSDFRKWLREDGGVYWITGKAGSGKSTLMKHIYDDPRTRQYLEYWAKKDSPGKSSLCFATFFFWNSGTNMQKSQQGLLRALLFYVLKKYPELIPIVFPERWSQLHSGSLKLGEQLSPESWSTRQLTTAFESLFKQQHFQIRFCILVDGLDEFDGDTVQLCQLFTKLALLHPKTTKFCLSSRPWVEFQDNFRDCASLRMQDLTSNDISLYVSDKLHANQTLRRLEEQDKKLTTALVQEIVEKADGVFLWVKIVVRLLLKGFTNRDSVSQLWKRLNDFPNELGPLYTHITSRIEPLHLEWTSKAFQIMQISRQLSSDPFLKMVNSPKLQDGLDAGVSPLTSIGIFLALEEELDSNRAVQLSTHELDKGCEDLQIHLTVRCAGLLEAATDHSHGKLHQDTKIRYMHRTARDFIESKEQWARILSHTKPEEFCPHFSMMKSSILSLAIKDSDHVAHMDNSAEMSLASDALIYAYHADGHTLTRESQMQLLRTFEKIYPSLGGPDMSRIKVPSLQHAALYGLNGYVHKNLSIQPDGTAKRMAAAALDHLFRGSRPTWPNLPLPTAKIVETLIAFAAIPRDVSPSNDTRWGPWPSIISWIPRFNESPPVMAQKLLETYASIIKIFLTAGADPTIIVRHWVPGDPMSKRSTFKNIIRQHLQPRYPDEAGSLIQALETSIRRTRDNSARHARNVGRKRKRR
ncbi:Vegetative incompatibility protein HET-E-1 [Lachnellula arida]|uniref:Vegetative incompatibility protein HET-E-1 n=1 Tax=Lachnellula arida TaxID=1316785 RepID=A0A8T9BND0_9HELO|nr:Vegetative incompatibility protein HET-E-1 [Lachnellula arida]